MPTIREEKAELRHREWAEQIQECQSSGMTVTAWCNEKGISQHTYYSRLNVVRKELLKRAGLPLQQIVPLSVLKASPVLQLRCKHNVLPVALNLRRLNQLSRKR